MALSIGVSMNVKQLIALFLILNTFISVNVLMAKEISQRYIPEELKEWKQWVLYQKDKEFCPFDYNNENNKHCAFISQLNFELDNDSGHFSISGILFKDQWINLPGQTGCWPSSVFNNKNQLLVIEKQNHPSVYLPEGEFHISGKFYYQQQPDVLWIPQNFGLISLIVNTQKILSPYISSDHRLWLDVNTIQKPQDNRLQMSIYRLITDDIPMTMEHCFKFSVSGKSREELFSKILPENSQVLGITSPLPVQIENNQNLRIHLSQGEWEILITTRFNKSINKLTSDFLSGKSEIWSFQAKNHLRMVKLMNVNGADPKNAGVPQQWQHYPAYYIQPNQSIFIQEQRRGDPNPSPDQLNLNRTLWLDFKGNGYTIHDNLNGKIHKNWRLNVVDDIQLGRVSFSNEDQLITTDNKNQTGVEVRTGQINISADSRYTKNIRKLPAIGWDHSMNQVKTNLNLPPGWRLLTASGVDTVTGSWFERWQLLDFFIALIIVMAIYHIKNIQWAFLGLITMIVTFHEPSAPRLTWLHLLAVIALLHVVPKGRFQSAIRLWFIAAIIMFSVYVLPFMMHQIRSGCFPQLETNTRSHELNRINYSRQQKNKLPSSTKNDSFLYKEKVLASPQRTIGTKQYSKDQFLSDAVVQTGPGLPQWRWHSVQLTWNGPVDKSQIIKLWLISPSLNLFLSLLRVIMVALLIIGIARHRSFMIHK